MKNTKKAAEKATDQIDLRKPIVKAYVDKDKEIENFILTRLPHVAHSKPEIKCVYKSLDNTEFRFRVNWFTELTNDIFMTIKKITASRYIRVFYSSKGYTIV